MKLNKNYFIAVFAMAVILTSVFAYCQETGEKARPLIVFYSTTCHKCSHAKQQILPDIERKFKDKISLEYHDIADIENYKLLLSLQEKYNAKGMKNTLPVFYFEGEFLNGEGRIKRDLITLIAGGLEKAALKKQDLPSIDLMTRFRGFEPLVITSAGLIDGINPCAFTVIVFFISFLTLQGYRKKELVVIGLSFIFSVFLTYILIGIGLFGFLYELKNFWLVAKIFNLSVGVLSIILGILAVYDIFKFKKSGSTEGLLLQLPTAVKKQIHSVIGLYYRKPKGEESLQRISIVRLTFSALVTGFLVSILEAVCTGQTYLPTISFVLKTSPLKLQALGYLLLYNFMFIVPLLVILAFALWGVTSEQFAKILKKNLFVIKVLMAMLFFGLGIFLIWRA